MTLAPDAVDDLVIDNPGVYPDLPSDVYHGDPVPGGSLSSSGARDLLPPSCPAKFRYNADHDRAPRKTWEIGHAAHNLVLGAGPELVLVDRPRWDTNAVKAEVADIRARGAVPLKRDDYETVHGMAAALRAHPVARDLFQPGYGDPEQSLFWIDQPTGVWRRARLDWLRYSAGRSGRLIIPDYKTTASADPADVARSMTSYGYHRQGAWYIDGALALMHIADAAFVLVAQEKTPPYLVSVCEPDATALKVGRRLNRDAIELYAECRATNRWPGYSEEVEPIALPAWVERMHLGDIW